MSPPTPAPRPAPEPPRAARAALAGVGIAVAALLLGSGLGLPLSAPAHAGDPSPSASAPVASGALTIYATGESLGSLEPCECVEGMAGGFPRRLALLEREARLRPGPRLVVDTGDQTGKAYHPRLLEAKTRAAFELLARSGAYAAVGERDLRLGVEPLRRLATSAGVELLAANLVQGEGRPFAGSALHRVGAERWRVVGLLDPLLCPPELEAEEPLAALRRELAREPRAPAVVLFHGEASEAAALAREPGVAAVICGHDAQRPGGLEGGRGAPCVEVVRDARSVARLELGPSPRLTRLALDGAIPDAPWARARVDRYYEEVAGLPEPPRRPTPAGGRFVGAETCRGCHAAQWKVFAETLHHGAQARIAKGDPKRAALPECVTCHVTGHGFEGGFSSLDRTPALGEVGCEVCHGVGERHVQSGGGKGFGLRPNFPASWKPLCVRCHDPSNSPDFDFAKALAKIKHWADR